MLNEADHCAIRLIDLQTPLAIETAATALDKEFEQAGRRTGGGPDVQR
jgi:hypothetical protein